MSDDLDDLLRTAMKTLDDQVPAGYFDGLPNQTLVRLEASMQTGTLGNTNRDPAASSSAQMAAVTASAPPATMATPREEDSGLHDIRSLAQSTKQRLTTKRVTSTPPMGDEIAASSGAWKHVALPEPAKMVSLPSLDELPSKEELRAAEKAAKKPKEAVTAVEAGAADAAIAKPAFTAWADRAPKKNRTGLYAVIGVGLAAAAGALIFVKTQSADKSAPVAASKAELEQPPAPPRGAVAQPPAPAEAKAAPAEIAADTTTAAAAIQTKVDDAPKMKNAGHATKGGNAKPTEKIEKADKPDKKDVKTEKKAGGGKESGDPSFDDLLKEAGVDGQKKVEKPKLDKKSLSEADFKHGIGAVAAKAAACYKGTQGTATVKLTVAPSGQVSKVAVGGVFSGKPEADCVANAVKGAAFPPWDGGPQSFSYAYLLSE